MPKNIFIRYILVGGTAYVIEMGSLFVLRYGLDLSPLVSAACSFWIGFAVAFVLQKFVTFQNYEKKAQTVARQAVLYSALTVWNYAFTLVLVKIFAKYASVLIIRTAAIAVITSWNFFVYKRFFRNRPQVVIIE